jgi:hypothetical protein
MNGMSNLDPEAAFATLLPEFESHKWDALAYQFIEPDHPRLAYEWADILVDLGGFCEGSDPDRTRYLEESRKQEVPYVYGATSFRKPDPELVKGVQAVARGHHSAMHYLARSGGEAAIGGDLAFLVEGVRWNKEEDPEKMYSRSFTVDPIISARRMVPQINPLEEVDIQLVLRRDREGFLYEPQIHPDIRRICLRPEIMFGLVQSLKEVHTARYSVAVAAVLYDIPTWYYGRHRTIYNELESFRIKEWPEIEELAMQTPKLVEEVLNANRSDGGMGGN